MKLAFALLIAAGLTVGAAWVHGRYTHRWSEPPDLSSAGEAIERLPTTIGPWEMVDQGKPLTPFVRRELGLVSHLNRWYQHAETGRRVQLLLMVGRPGPLVRHPPTVCYANRAHEQIGEPAWIDADATPGGDRGRFRLITYLPSRSEGEERFFVVYGHSVGAGWDVPVMPRVAYGAFPVLFKVQALANLTGNDDPVLVQGELAAFVRQLAESFDETVLAGFETVAVGY